MSQIFYRQVLAMPQGQPEILARISGGGPDVPTPHAGPGGVATTPSAAIFQGVNAHIIGTALVEGQTGSEFGPQTSDLGPRGCRLRIVHMLSSHWYVMVNLAPVPAYRQNRHTVSEA
jgi:hypothetical protein